MRKNTYSSANIRSVTAKRALLGAVCVLLIIACVYGVSGMFDGNTDQVALNDAASVPAEKAAAPAEPVVPAGPVLAMHAGTVGNGDTVSSILSQWVSPAQLHVLAQECKPVFNLRQIRVGQPYRIYTEDGNFSRMEYEIDDDKFLVVTPQDLEAAAESCPPYAAELHDIPYEYKLDRISGSITSSLFEAVEEAGENASLAIILADIFGWEIDFIRDLRQGDRFTAVVEKRYRDGVFKGYKRILAASFSNQGEVYEGFRMEDEHGVPQFYNAEGGNLRRAFLKAPLAFQRISSNYSPRRLHPVLKTYRPHHGVDYAAPTGTPVHAIGDGTVIKIARDHAAGNYIKVRHSNGYESGYLHLSRFARGLKTGKRVRQGETIGYVGSTGYATGPHLDFRMKKNGSYVNPRKVISPRSGPVPKSQMEAFLQKVQQLRPQLDGSVALGTQIVPKPVQNESN